MIMSTPFPPEEGIGNYVYNISRKLVQRGNNVTIMTRGSLDGTRKEMAGDIEVLRVRFIPIDPFHVHLHGLFVERQLQALSRSFDMVHIHTPL